jgi:hypothetical protein
MTAIDAAQRIVRSLELQQAPPQAHSVWVKTERDDSAEGGFKHSICVSLNPKYRKPLDIPSAQDGYPVKLEPWPKGMR